MTTPCWQNYLPISLFGIDAKPVEVEVDISTGAVPKTILVGLAEAAVRESTHRIERAMVNSGYHRPIDRVVINLSPADLPKEAASFDLPIALGMLTASSQLESDRFDEFAAVGELALDGTLRPIKGALSMALAAREQGKTGIVVPVANAEETAVVEGLQVFAVDSLAEAVGFFSGQLDMAPVDFSWDRAMTEQGAYPIDYSDVKGQEQAKRAVTVAAAGAHHLLMIGSPGSGKTLLASRLGTILPSLSSDESLSTTRIYSAVGRLDDGQSLVLLRPFRSPHHTISEAGLVGGGGTPAPGPYKLVRHPMYIGWLAVFWGTPTMTSAHLFFCFGNDRLYSGRNCFRGERSCRHSRSRLCDLSRTSPQVDTAIVHAIRTSTQGCSSITRTDFDEYSWQVLSQRKAC